MIIQADGHNIEVCRIPDGLIKGYEDLVFTLQTRNLFQSNIYSPTIEKAIAGVVNEVEMELGYEVEILKMMVHKWTPTNQITIVSLRRKENKE